MPSTEIEALILESLGRLTQHPDFITWRASEQPSPGDLLLVNNSFVFRDDVKTNKAAVFPAFVVEAEQSPPSAVIARGMRFNSPFKRMVAASSNLPAWSPLAETLSQQLEQLGHLVFLLIGEVHDTSVVEYPLKVGEYETAIWNPTIPEVALIEGNRIFVSRTDDEELVWGSLSKDPAIAGARDLNTLRQNLGVALDKLQDQAIAHVRIPLAGEDVGVGITDAILAVLREQRDDYAKAVQARSDARGDFAPTTSLNDVLRIAYNFASDATTFLRLIVSVCDLKPIVLWGTIAEHYELSVAFNALPWSRSTHKPSLKNYQQAIGDARNSAFHNIFPFRKSLRIPLPEMALGAPELQIFSEHTKRSQNQLTYRDRELVDVLIEFTRARERSLSMSFWTKNLMVMDATINLFQQTNDFVKALARARAP